MQDPFFQIAPESALSLDSFFNGPHGGGQGDQVKLPGGTGGPDGIATDSAEMKPEQAEAIEQAKPAEEQITPYEKATTLEERIKAVEKELNESMVNIYGKQMSHRLLTLASNLAKKGLRKQASTICDIIQDVE